MAVKTYLPMGKHAKIELSDCPDSLLFYQKGKTERILKKAITKTGASIATDKNGQEMIVVSVFPGGGYTSVIPLSESHFSIHTYPEYRGAFADCFTCGAECNPVEALDFLKKRFNAHGEISVELRKIETCERV